MKETEYSLSDQRLRNTLKDLRNAETEIRSLSKQQRHREKEVANGGLQEQISTQGLQNDHFIITRQQQRRVLKGVATILLFASLLTGICAVVGCKMTNDKSIVGDQQCNMSSNLGACRHRITARHTEAYDKGHIVKGLVVSKKKKRIGSRFSNRGIQLMSAAALRF